MLDTIISAASLPEAKAGSDKSASSNIQSATTTISSQHNLSRRGSSHQPPMLCTTYRLKLNDEDVLAMLHPAPCWRQQHLEQDYDSPHVAKLCRQQSKLPSFHWLTPAWSCSSQATEHQAWPGISDSGGLPRHLQPGLWHSQGLDVHQAPRGHAPGHHPRPAGL